MEELGQSLTDLLRIAQLVSEVSLELRSSWSRAWCSICCTTPASLRNISGKRPWRPQCPPWRCPLLEAVNHHWNPNCPFHCRAGLWRNHYHSQQTRMENWGNKVSEKYRQREEEIQVWKVSGEGTCEGREGFPEWGQRKNAFHHGGCQGLEMGAVTGGHKGAPPPLQGPNAISDGSCLGDLGHIPGPHFPFHTMRGWAQRLPSPVQYSLDGPQDPGSGISPASHSFLIHTPALFGNGANSALIFLQEALSTHF